MARPTTSILGLVLFATAAFAGTQTDFDAEANFSDLTTYQWKPGRVFGTDEVLEPDSPLARRIRAAVSAELEGKDMTEVDGDPDAYVTYYLAENDKTSVNTYPSHGGSYWGYGVGPRWGPRYNDVMVTHYTEGTLIVDIIRAADNRLVWRAYVTSMISERPDKRKLEKALRKAFRRFPQR